MTAGIAVAESTAAAANCVVMNAVNAPSAQEREVQPVPAMSTVEFLRSIWPSTGLYVIARFTDKGWRHTVCDTIEEAAAYAHQFDAQGVPTYMACAAYREREVVTTKPNGDVRRQVRIGRNVRAVRCFWMDLDVKPGVETAYESQDAAIDGIVEFCQATGLPTPMVVSSGGGVHIYFRLTEEIAPEAWKPTAEGLKSLAIKYRLKADHACTADPARVLRPVGTLNRKLVGCLRPVELIADADPIDFAQFKTAVDGALNRAGLEAPPEGVRAAESATEGINQAFAIQHNFPPCSATRVAERCAQLAAVRDARGNVPEPPVSRQDQFAGTARSQYPLPSAYRVRRRPRNLEGNYIGNGHCRTSSAGYCRADTGALDTG